MNKKTKKIIIQMAVLSAAIIIFATLNYYFDFIPFNFKFLSEKIHLTAGEKSVSASASFSFKNKTGAYKNITLFYPFYLQSGMESPENIRVSKIENGKQLAYPFQQTENGISLNLDFNPNETIIIVIEFNQGYNGKFYKFMLGYNRSWWQKIAKGEIIIDTGSRNPVKITPAMKQSAPYLYQLKRTNYFDDGVTINF